MASIRRTLSPVPRQGFLITGEPERSVPSLSSMSSSYNDGGLLSYLFGFSDSRALIFGVRSSKSAARSFDKSKHKGQVWERVLLHFFICFILGFCIGLTQFISMDFSYMNPGSKRQAFKVVSTVSNFRNLDRSERNITSTMNNEGNEKKVRSSDNAMMNLSVPGGKDLEIRKLLIVVTPTYARSIQAYYLNRLAYTLKLAKPPLLWIVVEMNSQSEETADILRRCGVMYRHLVWRNNNLTDIKDRHVHQRNVALCHIETHRLDGIVYFANEDNIYSIDLFQQMRRIRRFGTWTVAKQTHDESRAVLEGPVCNGIRVIGWNLNGLSQRFGRFHADMSGFAFNSTILWDPKRWHRPALEPIRQIDTVKDRFQANSFIEQVVEDESHMECLSPDGSRIIVWELNVESFNLFYPQKWLLKNNLDVIAPVA